MRGLVRARELCESGLAGLDGKIVPDAADLVLVYKKRTTRLARRGARQMDRECILYVHATTSTFRRCQLILWLASGASNEGRSSPLSPCRHFLALGFGLGLVGTVSARR